MKKIYRVMTLCEAINEAFIEAESADEARSIAQKLQGQDELVNYYSDSEYDSKIGDIEAVAIEAEREDTLQEIRSNVKENADALQELIENE